MEVVVKMGLVKGRTDISFPVWFLYSPEDLCPTDTLIEQTMYTQRYSTGLAFGFWKRR